MRHHTGGTVFASYVNPSEPRRRHPRLPLALRVREKSADFPEDTRDISKGGFSVASRKPLGEGSRTVFELSIPSVPVPLRLVGEVVWARDHGSQPGMGVRLIHSSDAQRMLYESYVERLEKDADRL